MTKGNSDTKKYSIENTQKQEFIEQIVKEVEAYLFMTLIICQPPFLFYNTGIAAANWSNW